jgi:hypothetical protein
VNIGLPFQIMYRPFDNLTLEASYMLLRTIHAKATYRLSPCLCVYSGFDWSNEAWFLANRPDVNDRFFYYDMRVTGGVKFVPARHVELDLSAGYAFNRFFFEGTSSSASQQFNRVDVGDGPFLAFRSQVRW